MVEQWLQKWLETNNDYLVEANESSECEEIRIMNPEISQFEDRFYVGPNKEIMRRWIKRKADTSIIADHKDRFSSKGTSIIYVRDCYVNMESHDIAIGGKRDGYRLLGESHHEKTCYSWILARNGIESAERYAEYLAASSGLLSQNTSKPKLIINTRWSSHNFFHWFYEAIPRLFKLRSEGLNWDNVLLVWAGKQPMRSYHLNSLTRLGIDTSKIYNATGCVNIDKLLLPTIIHRGGFHEKQLYWSAKTMKEHNSGEVDDIACSKVLIARSKGTIRSFEECPGINYLRKNGFLEIELSNQTLSKQIATIKNASLVVASHGAGLAHIVNMRQGARLIEIMPSDSIHPLYYYLACLRQLKYSMIVSKAKGGRQLLSFDEATIKDHIHCF